MDCDKEYAKAKNPSGYSVSINKIYIARAFNQAEELTVAYQCAINGKQYYYVAASYKKGDILEPNKYIIQRHLKIRGLEGYYIPSIGGAAFQEKSYFNMYYELTDNELDYYTIRDLRDKYVQEANYQVLE